MQPNQYYSYHTGELPDGCKMCVKGEKLVLLITGLCPRKCYYCPLSDRKYGHDVIFANERKADDVKDVMIEADMMDAKGAGITGGDPLVKIDRTCEYIRSLKKRFGKDFHIHLYTSLNLAATPTLKKLYDAGLDEIRFHPDLDDKTRWDRLTNASEFDWDIGVEIPIIPGKDAETRELIDFIYDKVKFINLNELEFADCENSQLSKLGYDQKDELSYAAKGSIELGIKMIEYVKEKGYPIAVHACTAKLKDGIQLTNRIKRESERARQPFDLVDEEGLLIRGALYLENLAPGVKYREKLAAISPDERAEKIALLKPILEDIRKQLDIDKDNIMIDKEKIRIILSADVLDEFLDDLDLHDLVQAVVTEYPTADQLEMEVEFLYE